jgi:hypothetical protein
VLLLLYKSKYISRVISYNVIYYTFKQFSKTKVVVNQNKGRGQWL